MSQRMRRVVRIRPVLVLGAISASIFFVGLGGSAGLAAPLPTPITYVCANSSNGQLSYVTPSCPKSSPSVPVTPTATQFKACYLPSSGNTRKVSSSTPCEDPPRPKKTRSPRSRPIRRLCTSAATRVARSTSRAPLRPLARAARRRWSSARTTGRPWPWPTAIRPTRTRRLPCAPGVLGNDADADGTLTPGSSAVRRTRSRSGSTRTARSLTRPSRTTTARTALPTRAPITTAPSGNTVTVRLTVKPVNDAPAASPTGACPGRDTVQGDRPLGAGQRRRNIEREPDLHDGDSPAHGGFSGSGQSKLYTPTRTTPAPTASPTASPTVATRTTARARLVTLRRRRRPGPSRSP